MIHAARAKAAPQSRRVKRSSEGNPPNSRIFRDRNVPTGRESYSRNPSSVLVDQTMEKALAYAISATLVGFGALIFFAGLSSSSPALWTIVALVPITIGIVSAFGPI
jgi:hypothetical protein